MLFFISLEFVMGGEDQVRKKNDSVAFIILLQFKFKFSTQAIAYWGLFDFEKVYKI